MIAKRLKPVEWIGSSHDDLLGLSDEVQDVFGFALFRAQEGGEHRSTKRLKGFAGVIEIRADDAGGTYRGVYAVRFAGVIYVLHVFRKKSRQGIATPKHEIELIAKRLKQAQAHYEVHKYEYQSKAEEGND